MDYRKISVETWRTLDNSGSMASGYKSIWLANGDNENSNLHIFKDEKGKFHFAIETALKSKIVNPEVNGLSVSLNQYSLAAQNVKSFIDICCNMAGYLEEFTQITKEISKAIFETDKAPAEIVNQVINNWKSFWANQNKEILSEDEQIGLICELKTLECLFKINPANALSSWVGPLGEKHDFNFSEWNFEIKGTRRDTHTHTINGIDQLKPAHNKRLGFFSFIVLTSENTAAFSLQDCIEEIIRTNLANTPNLVIRFNELLAGAGYSPIFANEYRKLKIEIHEAVLYAVGASFPSLTSDKLIDPLNSRISSVRYDISLEGLDGHDFYSLNWGEYFY